MIKRGNLAGSGLNPGTVFTRYVLHTLCCIYLLDIILSVKLVAQKIYCIVQYSLSTTIEWLYLLRSAKLCALWTAQAYICANSLAPVLRRAQSRRKTVLLRRLSAFHFLRRNSYLLRQNKRSLNQNSQFSPICNFQLSPWAAPIRQTNNYYST